MAHYWGAWIFSAAVAVHVATKFPVMRTAYRERGLLQPLVDDLTADGGGVEPHVAHGLAAPNPEPPTLTRRGLLALIGVASGGLAITTAGQSLGGPFRRLAVLAPRGGGIGFPVNKTAAAAAVTPAMVGAAWRLELKGARELLLSRADLLSLPQRTYDLPIACVEGWSSTQRWTGVRIADLARMAGAAAGDFAAVGSLQPKGVLRQASLTPGQVRSDEALLALKVGGEDLSMDHGFPARIVVPGLPGVHCTKWVGSMTFGAA